LRFRDRGSTRHARIGERGRRTFRFQRRLLFIANTLTDHHIGLEETDDGIWSSFFNTVLLAKLDERDYIIRG
jgi:hypothetical protein